MQIHQLIVLLQKTEILLNLSLAERGFLWLEDLFKVDPAVRLVRIVSHRSTHVSGSVVPFRMGSSSLLSHPLHTTHSLSGRLNHCYDVKYTLPAHWTFSSANLRWSFSGRGTTKPFHSNNFVIKRGQLVSEISAPSLRFCADLGASVLPWLLPQTDSFLQSIQQEGDGKRPPGWLTALCQRTLASQWNVHDISV